MTVFKTYADDARQTKWLPEANHKWDYENPYKMNRLQVCQHVIKFTNKKDVHS